MMKKSVMRAAVLLTIVSVFIGILPKISAEAAEKYTRLSFIRDVVKELISIGENKDGCTY